MQKKIIALAITAAFSAPAFAADTTVYGIIDAAVVNISATGVKGGTAVASSGLATSRVGIKAAEDLSSGMKASVVLEYGYDSEVATGVGTGSAANVSTRQKMLALSGDFGTVATGYLQTTGFDFSRFDPTAGSLVTPLGNLTKGGGFLIGNVAGLNRAPRALAYISPDMSGLTVALNYSMDTASGLGDVNTAESSAAVKGTAYLASANYAAGPMAAAFVYASSTAAINAAGVGGAKTTEWSIGGSYNLEMAKVFATYQTNKVDGANDSNKVLSISATMPVTAAGTAVVTYAKATMTAAGTDKDGSGLTLAWLQAMSKTTTAYAALSTMGQGATQNKFSVAGNAVTNVTAGEGSRMIAVGLSKKF